MRTFALVALAAAGLFSVTTFDATSAAASPPAEVKWKRCSGINRAECAHIDVALDHFGGVPGRQPLELARVFKGADKEWMLFIQGGPGAEGIRPFFSVRRVYEQIFRDFNILVFDPRGTGKSGRLHCADIERGNGSPRAMRRCIKQLGPRARFQLPEDDAGDIEAMRQRLGIDKFTIVGESFGTDIAIAYARLFPHGIKRIVMNGAAEYTDPMMAASIRTVVDSLKRLCPNGCRGISTNLERDLQKLLQRLSKRPLRGQVVDPRGKRRVAVLRLGDVLNVLQMGTNLPGMRAAFPSAMKAALHGDAGPLLRLAYYVPRSAGSPQQFSPTKNLLSVSNSASIPKPWPDGTPAGRERMRYFNRAQAERTAQGDLYPFNFAAFSFAVGAIDIPSPGKRVIPARGPYPAVPVLFVEGAEDATSTPIESAATAARFPLSQRLLINGVGHCLAFNRSECARAQLTAFLAGRAVQRCPDVPTNVKNTVVAPTSLRAVKARADVTVKVKRRRKVKTATARRVASAVMLTLRDALDAREIVPFNRLPGLRGGFAEARGRSRALVLHNYEFVPGVRVSGRKVGNVWKLRVQVKNGPSGVLSVRDDLKSPRFAVAG